jgi:hypothetical protein
MIPFRQGKTGLEKENSSTGKGQILSSVIRICTTRL